MSISVKPVAPAINIGSKLKILSPSSEDETMSSLESTVTKSIVKDLRPGFVVVQIDADSFSKISSNVGVTYYVVMSCSPYILKNLSDNSPACIRNVNQEVHVLNVYGISSLDSNMCEGIDICAPVNWNESQEVAKRGQVPSSASSTTLTTATPNTVSTNVATEPAKGELIFNFMGMVWGTNDPNAKDTQNWIK